MPAWIILADFSGSHVGGCEQGYPYCRFFSIAGEVSDGLAKFLEDYPWVRVRETSCWRLRMGEGGSFKLALGDKRLVVVENGCFGKNLY
jgi:hypothetical protein